MNQYTVIDEPDEQERAAIELRKAQVLAAKIVADHPAESCSHVSRQFWIKPQIAAPSTPAEASRRAIHEFRRATRGTTMIDHAKPSSFPKSQYKGVYSTTSTSRPWQVRASIDGKQKFVGSFESEEQAARAYDAARVKDGRQAVNFPDGLPAPASTAPAAATNGRGGGRTKTDPDPPITKQGTKDQGPRTKPASSLGRELAAAAAIAEALAGLDDAQARRVMEFVGGHYLG